MCLVRCPHDANTSSSERVVSNQKLPGDTGSPGSTVWRRDEAGRLHRLLEAEPMLVRVCQSCWPPASVLVRSTRSDEDVALASMVGGSDNALLFHPFHER